MSLIHKVDTLGSKPILDLGEFGFDMYTDGGDTGRIYIGTGLENIALARLDEVDTAVTSIGVEGQTNIVVSDSYNTLLRVDGVVLKESIDYTVANSTSVDLVEPLVGGESIVELNVEDALDTIRSKQAIPNGLATLGSTGLIPSSQLPSFVDDVIEVATYADLPTTGESGKIYVVVTDETEDNVTITYRWATSSYIKISDVLDGSEVKVLYDGEFTQRTTSNYIDTATKLDEVVDLLDTQAKVEEDARVDVDNKVLYLVPTTSTNPTNGVGTIAIDSGRVWVCTDSTADANIWTDVTKANNIEEWD